jgi:hypothetical protein
MEQNVVAENGVDDAKESCGRDVDGTSQAWVEYLLCLRAAS